MIITVRYTIKLLFAINIWKRNPFGKEEKIFLRVWSRVLHRLAGKWQRISSETVKNSFHNERETEQGLGEVKNNNLLRLHFQETAYCIFFNCYCDENKQLQSQSEVPLQEVTFKKLLEKRKVSIYRDSFLLPSILSESRTLQN